MFCEMYSLMYSMYSKSVLYWFLNVLYNVLYCFKKSMVTLNSGNHENHDVFIANYPHLKFFGGSSTALLYIFPFLMKNYTILPQGVLMMPVKVTLYVIQM